MISVDLIQLKRKLNNQVYFFLPMICLIIFFSAISKGEGKKLVIAEIVFYFDYV
jgi:hypothetical protein